MLKVIGFRTYSFIPKGKSETITGVTLYTTEVIPNDKGSGLQTGKLSLSDSLLHKNGLNPTNLINKEINVLYNQFGSPQDIQIIK